MIVEEVTVVASLPYCAVGIDAGRANAWLLAVVELLDVGSVGCGGVFAAVAPPGIAGIAGKAGAAVASGFVSIAAGAESAQLGADRAASVASGVVAGAAVSPPFQAGGSSVMATSSFHSRSIAIGGPSLILRARKTPSTARTAIVARGRIVLIGVRLS